MSWSVTRRIEWDAAHRVPLHHSKCKHLHGHRYAAEITAEADTLTREGFVVDFGEIKARVGQWIDDHLDHAFIYQATDELAVRICDELDAVLEESRAFPMTGPPTAENIAELIAKVAQGKLKGLTVTRVVVYETPNCRATWEPSGESTA